jgi:hypothetical protein
MVFYLEQYHPLAIVSIVPISVRSKRMVIMATRKGVSHSFTEAFREFITLKKERPEVFAAMESLIDDGNNPAPDEDDGGPEPVVKPKLNWKKSIQGDARIWTAAVMGKLLRVERRKTAKGTVYDAFLNDEHKLRSKSSVTARDRLAYILASDQHAQSQN